MMLLRPLRENGRREMRDDTRLFLASAFVGAMAALCLFALGGLLGAFNTPGQPPRGATLVCDKGGLRIEEAVMHGSG